MNEFDGDVIWEDRFDGFGEDWALALTETDPPVLTEI